MRSSPHRCLRFVALMSLGLACAAAPVAADDPEVSAHVAQLKEMQVRFMRKSVV